jgi:hypothetical protein
LEYGRARSVEFVISVQEEENIKCLLQDWVRSVIFLAKVIHLVQEAAKIVSKSVHLSDGRITTTDDPV